MFARFRHLLWDNVTILESVAEVDSESPPPTFYYNDADDGDDDHNDDNDMNRETSECNRHEYVTESSNMNDNCELTHVEELSVGKTITVESLRKEAEQLIKDQMLIKANFEHFQHLMENNFINNIQNDNQQDVFDINVAASKPSPNSLQCVLTDSLTKYENPLEIKLPIETSVIQNATLKNRICLKSEKFLIKSSDDVNDFPNDRIVIEEVPSEMNTPSPTAESVNTTTTTSTSYSNSSTIGANSSTTIINFSTDSSKIIIKPIQNNALACHAITDKLTEIAKVAESLDAVIRDIQDHTPCMELESTETQSTQNTQNTNNGNGDRKVTATVRSNSCEDWHSRSTEDESFVTASEGNFTPFSQTSSSYRTASARTNSSVISCDKNNSSDLDEITFPTEVASPLNTSFEDSEQSFIIGQIKTDIKCNNSDNNNMAKISPDDNHKESKLSTKQFIDNSCQTECDLIENSSCSNTKAIATTTPHTIELNDDAYSTADIEELHSEQEIITSILTTTDITIPKSNDTIESDIDLEITTIQDSPSSLAIITETRRIESVTPEVSLCSIHSSVVDEPHVQIQQQRFNKTNANNNKNNNNSWRHSKYYENITKQTIKGFL